MRDHAEVRRVLRQRYPMLLLDRVVAASPPRSLVAVKAVTAAEPCYAHLGEQVDAGGFAYPLALLVESFGQAVLVLWTLGGHEAGVPLLAGLRDVVAGAAAGPGDLLEHHVRLEQVSGRSAIFSGHTEAGGRRILEVGSLIAALRPESDLTG